MIGATRRRFIASCAAFVAGCAVGVGVELAAIKKTFAFDDRVYMGDIAWINHPVRNGGIYVGRGRGQKKL